MRLLWRYLPGYCWFVFWILGGWWTYDLSILKMMHTALAAPVRALKTLPWFSVTVNEQQLTVLPLLVVPFTGKYGGQDWLRERVGERERETETGREGGNASTTLHRCTTGCAFKLPSASLSQRRLQPLSTSTSEHPLRSWPPEPVRSSRFITELCVCAEVSSHACETRAEIYAEPAQTALFWVNLGSGPSFHVGVLHVSGGCLLWTRLSRFWWRHVAISPVVTLSSKERFHVRSDVESTASKGPKSQCRLETLTGALGDKLAQPEGSCEWESFIRVQRGERKLQNARGVNSPQTHVHHWAERIFITDFN